MGRQSHSLPQAANGRFATLISDGFGRMPAAAPASATQLSSPGAAGSEAHYA
jgi:hypothetical protein